MRAAIGPRVDDDDAEVLTEVFWAALHGLVLLGQGGRLRPDQHLDRIDLMVDRLRPGKP
ncbi:TetR-like C-terminal domain-containing protein [Rathayibacter oskolensis]|uniref:TetR-like C-terminal domain-containing protein n=1 Tax=Rathayibacter oskolensis TaxID=1891671 RepID=UPI00101AD1F1|nr:TetR-like C-terminal domain-containing protein [Rathayibacter oskolensis]